MTTYIGPIPLDLLNLDCKWAGTPSKNGRAAAFSGEVSWPDAGQLVELADNADRAVTIGDTTGVLEYIWAGDTRRDFNGWYLITQAELPVGYALGNADDLVPVTISAVALADRQVAVVRSARARDNEHSLDPQELLVSPFPVPAGNSGFAVEPAGAGASGFEREFDSEHASGLFSGDVVGRGMQLRVADVGTLPQIVLPALVADGSPPLWLVQRGGDCRAWDVAAGRAVYGPAHPFAEPSDLVLENGLLRAWCGGRGIVPYFTVASFVDGAWRQFGCVALADETAGPVLDGARLLKVTPDVVTAALNVRDIGDVFVSLRRGERMLRIQHGNTRLPTASATRVVTWLGTPPTIDGVGDADVGTGRFGSGVALFNTVFVPTPYNKAMVSTLAYDQPGEPDGSTFFTYSGTRYMAAVENATVVVWQESAVFPGTFGRRNALFTMPSTHVTPEGEGMAYGVVGGLPVFLVGDQNNNHVWAVTPASGIMGGTWSSNAAPVYDGTYTVGASGVHTIIAYDWDGDGDAEFVFCDEDNGKVMLADYDGSGDVTDPANWTVTQIASLAHARTIAQNCPADIMGNGRGDIVIACRSNAAGAKVFILEAPAAGSIHSTWASTGLTGFTYTKGAMWACLFDAEGSGDRLDIASFDGTTGDPHYWLASEGYASIHYLPDPTIDTGDSAWVIGAVADPTGGPDILMYSLGDQANGTEDDLFLFYWNGDQWESRPAKTFEYGHALESLLIEASVTGLPDRGEMLMSDSGGSFGGQRMALFSFYDDNNVPLKTAPTVAQAASNNATTASLTVTLPGAPTNGHLLVALVTASTSTETITPPAGWEPVSYFKGDVGFVVYMKVAASDAAASVWGQSLGTHQIMVTVLDLAGADTTHPIMCHGARRRPAGTSATIKNPSIGVDESAALVIGCWGFSNTQASAPTYPAGFTQRSFAGGQRRHAVATKAFGVGETGALDAAAAAATQGVGFSLAIRGV